MQGSRHRAGRSENTTSPAWVQSQRLGAKSAGWEHGNIFRSQLKGPSEGHIGSHAKPSSLAAAERACAQTQACLSELSGSEHAGFQNRVRNCFLPAWSSSLKRKLIQKQISWKEDFVPRACLKMLAVAGGPLSPQLVHQGRG